MRSVVITMYASGAAAPRNALRQLLRSLRYPLASLAVVIFLLASACSGPSPPDAESSSLSQAPPPPGSSRPSEGAGSFGTPPPPLLRSTIISYDGLWRAAAPPSEAGKFQSLGALVAFGGTLPADYQLTDFEIDVRTGDDELLGVWSQVGETAHQLHIDLSSDDFQAKRLELTGQYQLFDFELYAVDGQRRYAGVWRPSADDEQVEVDLTWGQLVAGVAGYHLVDVEPYATPAGWRYAGLWHPGMADVELEHTELASDFLTSASDLAQEGGWRLTDVERRKVEGGDLYVALWQQGTDPDWLTLAGNWNLIEKNKTYLPAGNLPPESNGDPGSKVTPPVSIDPRHLMDIEVVRYAVDGTIIQNAIHDEPTTGPPDG